MIKRLKNIKGLILYQIQAQGPLNNLKASFDVNLNQPGYKDFQSDRVRLQGQMQNRKMVIDKLVMNIIFGVRS